MSLADKLLSNFRDCVIEIEQKLGNLGGLYTSIGIDEQICLISISTGNKFLIDDIKRICISPDASIGKDTAYLTNDDGYFNYKFIDENYSIDIFIDASDDKSANFEIFISYSPEILSEANLFLELKENIRKYIPIKD